MFIREIELGEDEDTAKLVKVDQKNEGDTGVVVWDAAIVLSKYLETIIDDLANKSAIGNINRYVVVNTVVILQSLEVELVLLDCAQLPWGVAKLF